MNVLISGSTGLVGNALSSSLFSKGHTTQALHRNKRSDATPQTFWETTSLSDNFQAVVHLAGENIASGRWNSEKKEAILNSRINGTRALVEYISQMPDKPKIFLCASAVGYYGDCGDTLLDESSPLGQGFLANVCKQWEEETAPLTEMGVRVVNIRFGMVLSPKGGALHKMISPFRMWVGGVIGSGKQYLSWISIRDLVEIVAFLIEHDDINGPVNVVSPNAVTNKEFTHTLAKALGVPAFLKIPSFMIKMLFGQMGEETVLASTRATPAVLTENGYTFKDSHLTEVLRYCTQNV